MRHLALALVMLAGASAFAGNAPSHARLAAATWESCGLDADTVFSICVEKNGTILAGTFSQGVKRSTDDAATWKATAGLTGIRINGMVEAQGALWAGTELNGLYKSTDDGATWTSVALPNPPLPATVSVRKVTTNKDGWLVASAYDVPTDAEFGFGISSDAGKTWQGSNLPTGANGNVTDCITVPSGKMYASVKGSNGILQSTDGGLHWAFTGMTQSYRVTSLGYDGQGNVFASTGVDDNVPAADGIYRSTDGGATWNPCNTGVPSPSAFGGSGTIVTGNDGSIFAGSMSNGVLRSTDHGGSWTLFNAGLKVPKSVNLTKDGSGRVYCCGLGLFRTSAAIAGVEERTGMPEAFSLKQNYPNPFNPATVIEFSIAKAGSVRLSVFDMLGREVAVLVNGAMPAGAHIVKFGGANLASGSYICRLQQEGNSASKVMTLVR